MSDEKHEIVIIRRGGHGDHDEHHGGVWKIAFADFMTAMMAFFLVMWLISANDKTRASVARYFNPVKLVDATTQPRGLHDSKKDESGITASPQTKKPENSKAEPSAATAAAAAAAAAGAETPAQRDKRLDTALRDNPFVALAEIAQTKGPGDKAREAAHPTQPVIGRRGGDAFRDPFAPPPAAPGGSSTDDDGTGPQTAGVEAGPAGGAAVAAAPAKPAGSAGDAARKADATRVEAALTAGLGQRPGPHVDVRRTDEGLLVSLTDTADFAMFSNGSAVPSRRIMTMMDTVAAVLKTRPGQVIVRGFTDNRPFRSGRYDNWHLSLDRAQVTHYMLVRGGLDDARIAHVEGYADRGIKPGTDAGSPVNRRIEILLRQPAR